MPKVSTMEKHIKDQWDANAIAFAILIGGQGTPHHRMILNPCIDSLMGNVEGKRLLDAGCGEGYLSRYYAEKGADVVGVDISSQLIEICKEKARNNQEFHVGDICDLKLFRDTSFDLILCNLVLLNVPCLFKALEEFQRVLRNTGHLVFSIVHPAFDFYGPGTWEMGEKDSETNRRIGLFFKIDNYFDERPYERYWRSRDGRKFPRAISFFHRTISTYINAILNAGFQIQDFREPTPITDDAFFERERRIPFFAVFKVGK
ncbi:MAG: methyltransferase domain-containing protein [Candidatus Lokiarchaeota archaeon]|nr:methyltransferase domain-containing protein [Candidatus Lokiarchaeota archaeon]